MKKIYLVLTHTGTTLSTIIKCYTKDEFSHISIALDEELNEMYSFGRLHANNPFIGGFVHESIDFGTFKRFKNTQTEIYSLEIDNNKYEDISNEINAFKNNYNLADLSKMEVVYYGIKVGACKETELTIDKEFDFQKKKTEVTAESILDGDAQSHNEELYVYDIVLAGVEA